MKTYYLDIAGFGVRLDIDDAVATFALPSSYKPFITDGPVAPQVMNMRVVAMPSTSLLAGCRPVAAGFNDLGEARLFTCGDAYAVAVSPFPESGFRIMHISADFTRGTLFLSPGDPYSAFCLDSMMRILFSQAIVAHDAFVIHASAVVADGRAYLFMGRSGTGKSTHTGLWLKEFDDARLLNDDNPVVRALPDGSFAAFGTPWSGKTHCYRNESAPLSAMVRLRQSPANIFTRLTDVQAFVAILPGVSVISHSRKLYDKVCSTVIAVAKSVTIGELQCRPDADAARLSRHMLEIDKPTEANI